MLYQGLFFTAVFDMSLSHVRKIVSIFWYSFSWTRRQRVRKRIKIHNLFPELVCRNISQVVITKKGIDNRLRNYCTETTE